VTFGPNESEREVVVQNMWRGGAGSIAKDVAESETIDAGLRVSTRVQVGRGPARKEVGRTATPPPVAFNWNGGYPPATGTEVLLPKQYM